MFVGWPENDHSSPEMPAQNESLRSLPYSKRGLVSPPSGLLTLWPSEGLMEIVSALIDGDEYTSALCEICVVLGGNRETPSSEAERHVEWFAA